MTIPDLTSDGRRKRPMGEQAVPEWGLHPWIEISYGENDPVFEEVAFREVVSRLVLARRSALKSPEKPRS